MLQHRDESANFQISAAGGPLAFQQKRLGGRPRTPYALGAGIDGRLVFTVNSLQKEKASASSNVLSPVTCHLSTSSRGFSLVEMVVSVGLFAVIMLVAMGALLSLVEANRKSRVLESVMNNLNISLDSMVRAARMGSNYVCNDDAIPLNYATNGADCATGETMLSFTPYGESPSAQNLRAVYSFKQDVDGVGRLYRSLDGGASEIPVTAPEVEIDDVKFYVIGTTPGDTAQPKVVIVIKGSAGAVNTKSRTTFYIQATAVQRVLDI